MNKAFCLFFLVLYQTALQAQAFTLSGRITDKDGGIPFATVMVKGNAYASNSNSEGYYQMNLPAGSYEVVFQYIGYRKKTVRLELNTDRQIDVELEAEGFSLREVEIMAGEDPAYPIIRNAIKKRAYYLHQLTKYTCRAYVKGLQRIDRLPGSIAKMASLDGRDPADTSEIKGVVYLSESETRYYYDRPDEKEIMFSSKVSGNNTGFSFNRLSVMKTNFYKNLIDLGGIGSRPFVSPVGENALFHYKYFLLGNSLNEGKLVHKIRVVPKRSGEPCFSGVIYIQDSAWRLTGIDLMLTREARIMFVDTLRLRQQHVPLSGDTVWMPANLNLNFSFNILGIQGSGYFDASIREYDLQPQFNKGFFKNELLKVEDGANQKDSLYWQQHRAVPLTSEEAADYRKKDSLARIYASDRYIDSTDRKHNRYNARSLLLGYSYRNSHKNLRITLPGLITDGIQYNTVEGLNLSYRVSLEKRYEDQRRYAITGRARYGFSNKLWGGLLEYHRTYRPVKFSEYGFSVKSMVTQFNSQMPMPEILNTSYTLFNNENFMKLYRESGVEGSWASELLNGFLFRSSVSYLQRDPLRNTSYVVFRDDPGKWFSSNDPQQADGNGLSFSSNRAFTFELSADLSFRQKYFSLPNQKIIARNRYPRLSLRYKKAIPAFGATASFDLLSAALSDDVKAGLFAELKYRLSAGKFLSSHQMSFMDYQHFAGNQTMLNTHDYLKSFRLLPYYQHSTNNWFAEAHAEHHFNGLLFSYLPVLAKSGMEEVLGGHLLMTGRLQHYYEVNFGVEKILRLIRFDFILGYEAGQPIRSGFSLGLNFTL